MGLMGALGSAVGGLVLGAWGFPALSALGALCVVGSLAAGLVLRQSLSASVRSEAKPSTL